MSARKKPFSVLAEEALESAAEAYWNAAVVGYAQAGIPAANVRWCMLAESCKEVERNAVAAALNVILTAANAERKKRGKRA